MAISEDSKPEDFIRPGHVFPLISRNGGVLVRAGHTEGSVDLSRLAGLKPASVICEIMKDDGDMARLEDLLEFSNKHKIKIATIADLIRYRLSSEKLVNNVLKEKVTTEFGKFDVLVYESDVNKNHHVAFVKGDINPDDKVMVRVHTDCMISDVFGAVNSYSKAMINESMKIINDHGCGVLLYIRQESNPDILKHHIQMFSNIESEDKHSSYNKEDDKTKPELRNYGIGAQILKDLGVRKIRLLTNHPIKVKGLEGFGLKIVERIHIDIPEHVRDEKLVRAENENIDNFLSIVNEKG